MRTIQTVSTFSISKRFDSSFDSFIKFYKKEAFVANAIGIISKNLVIYKLNFVSKLAPSQPTLLLNIVLLKINGFWCSNNNQIKKKLKENT